MCDMDDAGHWWFGNVEGQKKQGWFPTEYVRKVRKVAFILAALLSVQMIESMIKQLSEYSCGRGTHVACRRFNLLPADV